MLDSYLRRVVALPLDFTSHIFHRLGVTADGMTLTGFCFGLVAIWCVASNHLEAGPVFFIVNRLCDGLDGSLARIQGLTDRGGFIDIVSDFIIYSGIVFAFALSHPEDAIWSAFLVFSFMGASSSFSAYAIMAAKQNKSTQTQGPKSFYYLSGISEGSETILAIALMCLYPEYFEYIALIYGLLCWVTTIGRVTRAWLDFRK